MKLATIGILVFCTLVAAAVVYVLTEHFHLRRRRGWVNDPQREIAARKAEHRIAAHVSDTTWGSK